VASAADDLAAVLDTLHAERVGVAGWSAGGRVALALAARRPDLVDRVAVLGTPAPDEEEPWIEPEQRAQLERLRNLAPEEVHSELCERLGSVVPQDPHSPDALWLLGAGSADEAGL
jgi:pimeloyl-ACP methyl ester carboxylesterase